MKAAIQLNGVSKIYKDKKAVDNLTLSIAEGTVVALLGPERRGQDDDSIHDSRPAQADQRNGEAARRRSGEQPVRDRIGAMLQDVSVIDGLKVAESINLFRSYYEKPLALAVFAQVSNLEAEKDKMASVALRRTAAPSWFCAGAGRRSRSHLPRRADGRHGCHVPPAVLGHGARDGRQGRTIVLTTHYLDEADSVADRIVVINNGKIIADGTPGEIKAETTGRVISFIAGRVRHDGAAARASGCDRHRMERPQSEAVQQRYRPTNHSAYRGTLRNA